MQVHLVDGTYELFRYHYALPSHMTADGREVAATRGVVGSVLRLLEDGATHVGVATDHIVESFRNELWADYKTGDGIDPDLFSQFPLVEEVLEGAGVRVWAMVEHEADDALAAAAAQLAADERVERVLICTPDKDLAQCVVGERVVQWDRRKDVVYDHAGVREKFGVDPASIPDYLALVGDSADGFPGLPGWGAKSTARVLAAYGHLEAIPTDASEWNLDVRGASKLVRTLCDHFDDALLFRRLATLDRDAVTVTLEDLAWTGPRPGFAELCASIDAAALAERAEALVAARG